MVGAAYFAVAGLYTAKELRLRRRMGHLHVPKQALLLRTALSWYVGIVLYSGDMPFTPTNVVAHGIPDIALVWIFGRNRWMTANTPKRSSLLRRIFTARALPVFVALLLLAYFEEALWDARVWRDRGALLWEWYRLPYISDSDILLWLAPLLAVPQATHYVLDGFLRRIRNPRGGMDEISRGAAASAPPAP